jgi:2-polyprenyl-3-methyl-5-hydroxy-6-metoxy-1,4-benzoquinol methylase
VSGYVSVNERPLGGHARLLELALAHDPRRALDVGCSSGYLARPLVERGVRVVGIELDPRAADEARSVCDEVLVGDVETLEFPFEHGSFDLVLCGDLVEHLRDPGAALERLRPLLRPGGRLVLTTPNIANWAIRLSLLGGRWRYTDRGILDRTHVHLFTRKTLVETIEAAGFRVLVLDHTAPVPIVGTPTVERIAHGISRLRPSLFAYQFLVAATPR